MFEQLLIIYSVFLLQVTSLSNNNSKNYGQFNLQLDSVEVCNGPKLKSCAICKASIEDNITLTIDVTVNRNMIPSKGKILVYADKKLLLRFQLNNPCNHLFLRPTFESIMNVTKNCAILKGHYKKNINIQELAQSYYSGMFVYGNLTFTSIFYSEECNLSCVNLKVLFLPKDKKNDKTK